MKVIEAVGQPSFQKQDIIELDKLILHHQSLFDKVLTYLTTPKMAGARLRS